MIANSISNSYFDIIEQFANDAAFLWVLRSIAIDSPHYNAADIGELEDRINKQLDGLFTSPELAWQVVENNLAFEEPGEVFCAAVFAFRTLEMEKIKVAVDAGFTNEATFKGLVSALGWLPERYCHEWIERFYTSKDMRHKYLALAASRVRREDPGEHLNKLLDRDDCKSDKNIYLRALRCIGEFKRFDLVESLNLALNSDDEDIKFWSIWSHIFLGNRNLVNELKPYVLQEGANRRRAIQMAFRCLPIATAKQWITELSEIDEGKRLVIEAATVLGDPQVVPWLIGLMKQPILARLAGESFTTITGIAIEDNDLNLDVPDLDSLLPTSDDDAPVELDEDESLPWPDAEKLSVVWQKYGNSFDVGCRYLSGMKIVQENMVRFKQRVDPSMAFQEYGNAMAQRIRHAVALELAVSIPQEAFINTQHKVLED